jgi:NADH:ubiquinone oxidoreductase subunit E
MRVRLGERFASEKEVRKEGTLSQERRNTSRSWEQHQCVGACKRAVRKRINSEDEQSVRNVS